MLDMNRYFQLYSSLLVLWQYSLDNVRWNLCKDMLERRK